MDSLARLSFAVSYYHVKTCACLPPSTQPFILFVKHFSQKLMMGTLHETAVYRPDVHFTTWWYDSHNLPLLGNSRSVSKIAPSFGINPDKEHCCCPDCVSFLLTFYLHHNVLLFSPIATATKSGASHNVLCLNQWQLRCRWHLKTRLRCWAHRRVTRSSVRRVNIRFQPGQLPGW